MSIISVNPSYFETNDKFPNSNQKPPYIILQGSLIIYLIYVTLNCYAVLLTYLYYL